MKVSLMRHYAQYVESSRTGFLTELHNFERVTDFIRVVKYIMNIRWYRGISEIDRKNGETRGEPNRESRSRRTDGHAQLCKNPTAFRAWDFNAPRWTRAA